jgi:hypothetical protein
VFLQLQNPKPVWDPRMYRSSLGRERQDSSRSFKGLNSVLGLCHLFLVFSGGKFVFFEPAFIAP